MGEFDDQHGAQHGARHGSQQDAEERERRSAEYKRDHPAAFPKLDANQLATLEDLARLKSYRNGEFLLRAGDTESRFHVVRSGRVEIVDRSSGAARTVLVHEPGEFTGDLANLAGRASNVDAVALGDVDVYEISKPDFQRIISERPNLSDLILQTFIARSDALVGREDFTGLRVIGSQYSRDTFRIRDFLFKNSVLYTWIDVETDSEVGALLEQFRIRPEETPVVSYANDWVLRNPSNSELAEKIGLRVVTSADTVFDLAIVGAGPAGLAAAVYGASEGLDTIVLERIAPGGQAAGSAKIENYLGFPTGLSGADLAERATLQAQKFGAQLSTPAQVMNLHFDGRFPVLELEDGGMITARALLIASGANYRKLPVPGRERFDGAGVYYAATAMEARMCAGGSVAVVGGGNSAGQAAIFLSEQVRRVFLLVRRDNLAETMSHYLLQRIEDTPGIEILTHTEISQMHGTTHLQAIEVVNNQNGETRDLAVAAVFSFIGAIPCTEWLPGEIETDRKGFVRTGPQVALSAQWNARRQPFLLETSRAGVFAAGDVRADSVKRVASAVGEGSMAVRFVHEYLKEI
jgi:thioredoxin reductase (NADPH)